MTYIFPEVLGIAYLSSELLDCLIDSFSHGMVKLLLLSLICHFFLKPSRPHNPFNRSGRFWGIVRKILREIALHYCRAFADKLFEVFQVVWFLCPSQRRKPPEKLRGL